MKRKLMLIGGGGLVFASSFPMTAASCDVKKKDVETSSSKKQGSKPNSESKSENQDSETNSQSKSEKEDSKPNSESKSENQDSETNSQSKSGKQDSETNGSSNELTKPSEKTQNDMPTENSVINDYLDKVMEYGKEASELITLLEERKEREEKVNELLKKPGLWKIVEELSSLYESSKYDLNAFKKEIEEVLKNPRDKNELSVKLKQYKGSSEEIKNAIKDLKGFKRQK
ncbi:Mbov_0283/Mbov_0339 family surface lipoprotein [Mycoplasmopsis bovis]|uniref:Mbov_0283/Mbov_0339 family surface lipoprotein n=1 Tax=Mycoplasmopsis bovis TaxID=28903 RepID=UPI003D289B64